MRGGHDRPVLASKLCSQLMRLENATELLERDWLCQEQIDAARKCIFLRVRRRQTCQGDDQCLWEIVDLFVVADAASCLQAVHDGHRDIWEQSAGYSVGSSKREREHTHENAAIFGRVLPVSFEGLETVLGRVKATLQLLYVRGKNLQSHCVSKETLGQSERRGSTYPKIDRVVVHQQEAIALLRFLERLGCAV